jgi:3-methyl-2-oxobutanoate hydroxymethyltransferase
MSIPNFLRARAEGRRLTMVTCYDYTFGRLLADSPVDAILVGDSLGMVMHGHPSTIPVTLDMMRLHTEAVARALPGRFLIADFPFLAHRKGKVAALDAAQALLTAGATAVKLEGVEGHEDVIRSLVQSGIPVMGHLGLQPQSVNLYGGFRVQGRTDAAAEAILRDARTLEQLGAFSIVLECIPADLAREVTDAVSIPTWGIGAGPYCTGQILVIQDLLGFTNGSRPKFVRPFLDGARLVKEALSAYDTAVKSGEFPSEAESYT